MNNLNINECEHFNLWWHCPISQSREKAGVAFYDDRSGDYRVYLNFFPDSRYLLRCMGGSSECLKYRFLSCPKNGGGMKRYQQGEGLFVRPAGEIVIQTAPFSKLLILSLKGKSKKVARR